jgi:hypothetical protein
MPGHAVSFTLALPKEATVAGGQVVSKEYVIRGLVRLEGDRLTLEWSGSVEITEVIPGSVRKLRQSVPAQRLVLPMMRIAAFELHRRWWRPYIELKTNGIGPLELVPGAQAGRVALHIGRRERRAASELISDVQLAMADAALREAESQGQLPRESADR